MSPVLWWSWPWLVLLIVSALFLCVWCESVLCSLLISIHDQHTSGLPMRICCITLEYCITPLSSVWKKANHQSNQRLEPLPQWWIRQFKIFTFSLGWSYHQWIWLCIFALIDIFILPLSIKYLTVWLVFLIKGSSELSKIQRFIYSSIEVHWFYFYLRQEFITICYWQCCLSKDCLEHPEILFLKFRCIALQTTHY